MRTVKQSSVVREAENGEEGEEEGAEFGEEDLFHQQVEVPEVARWPLAERQTHTPTLLRPGPQGRAARGLRLLARSGPHPQDRPSA